MGDDVFNDTTPSPPAPNINNNKSATTAINTASQETKGKQQQTFSTTQQNITKWLNNTSTTECVENFSKAITSNFKALTKQNKSNN
jgi:hypothetical protein